MAGSVFSRHTSKNACVKENKHVFFLCTGDPLSCVQIKSSDCCDVISAKLKFLNSYDYIFNPALFIVNLESSRFGSRENIPVSQQNSQTFKEICAHISIFFDSSFMLAYCTVIVHFCYSFNLKPSTFCENVL